MAWKASCPKASEDGACLEVKRVAATGRQKVFYDLNKKRKKGQKIKEPKRTQCGPPTSSKIIVFDRNKGPAAKAQEHFQTVLKIWNKGAAASKITGKDVEARAGLAAYAVAGVGLPPGGDGVRGLPPHQVPRRPRLPAAEPVRQQEEGRGEEEEGRGVGEEVHQPTSTRSRRRWAGARDQYLEVFKMKQAQWAIASSARIGQLYADFVGQLYTAEIPKDLKVQDEWGNRPQEIFCDALVDKAEPIELKAVEGFDTCLKAATDYSWYNEWSRLCEKELNQMKPSEYPLSSEVKPEAGYVSTTMSPSPVVLELSESTRRARRRSRPER